MANSIGLRKAVQRAWKSSPGFDDGPDEPPGARLPGCSANINRVLRRKQTERLNAGNPADIQRAAELLRSGRMVAFPTETVYGLGANALDPCALEQIFEAKQRPHWDPLIVHIAARDQLPAIAEAGPTAQRLIDRFWPGPLTLLLPRTSAVPDLVTAGRDLVGVRMPKHPVALELLRQAGVPIAAPSANTFGYTSPTTAQHVLDDLDGRIDAVLDGGSCRVGLESTVAEIVSGGVIIYRPGGAELDSDFSSDPPLDLGWVRMYTADGRNLTPRSLPSPGTGIRHYAPRARLVLISDLDRIRTPRELSLVAAIDEVQTDTGRVGVMLPQDWNRGSAELVYRWGAWGDPETLARHLYDGLRQLDEQGATVIVCPVPPANGLGSAIRDRLEKAARVSLSSDSKDD